MSDVETVLIDRGDIPSLAALAIQADASRIVLVHPAEDDGSGRRRREIVDRHAEVFGVGRLVTIETLIGGTGLPAEPEPLRLARQLVETTVAAARLGLRRVIDPRQIGPDADLVGEAVDHLTAATLLVQAGPQGRPMVIEMPMLDLPDGQVTDLAEDAGAPMQLGWPCEFGGRAPCNECGTCLRWLAAFDEAGLTWPWTAVPVG